MSQSFYVEIEVKKEDIDDLNHVNNAVYVQWMDAVAREHWSFLTKNTDVSNYIWMVNKHEIDYKNQAFLGDTITAKTYVGETGGVKSIRFIEFYKDDVLIVKSKTTWVLLDAKTYKPTRIRENITNLLLPNN